MTDEWIVSWLLVEVRHVHRGASITPKREHKSFDSQKDAVSFAICLLEPLRRSAELHMPGGQPVGIAVIEQMHADQQAREKRGTD